MRPLFINITVALLLVYKFYSLNKVDYIARAVPIGYCFLKGFGFSFLYISRLLSDISRIVYGYRFFRTG